MARTQNHRRPWNAKLACRYSPASARNRQWKPRLASQGQRSRTRRRRIAQGIETTDSLYAAARRAADRPPQTCHGKVFKALERRFGPVAARPDATKDSTREIAEPQARILARTSTRCVIAAAFAG